ncbi:MAG TPA: ATP synthase subunit I [Gammaproteobacteria bacterium]|nr:ATP synthase subunit I [Gammaproteobacteria bacterium]
MKPAFTITRHNMGSIVFRRVGWVILLVACISVALLYLFSINKSISFALGAGISLFPMLLFGRLFFKTRGSPVAKKIVSAFYIGEAIKILTTIVLFVLVFQWQELAPLFLFLGFMVTQLSCLLVFL